MVNKKKANCLLSLPKKVLQALCRRYGMPSYKPKPYLAEALVALLPENYELKCLTHRGADTCCSQSIGPSQNCLDLNVSLRVPGKKCSAIMLNYPSNGELPVGNPYVEFMSSENDRTPTLEFHVQSEAGINLYVDLNSTLSEWAEGFKNIISLPRSSRCTKRQRSHEDLASSGEGSSHPKGSLPVTVSETDVEHFSFETTPNLGNKDWSSKEANCLGRVDASVMSSKHTMEERFSKNTLKRVSVVPKSRSCIQNPVPVSASSDDQNTENIGHTISNSTSDGAISFLTSEQQLKATAEECVISSNRYDCNPFYLGSAIHKSSKFTSAKNQPSETASFQKDEFLHCITNEAGSLYRDDDVSSEQGDSRSWD